MSTKQRDPQTTGEWQDAVDAAQFHLLIDSARQYGLIAGGAKVNHARAEQLLAAGRERGITPASTEALVRKFVRRG